VGGLFMLYLHDVWVNWFEGEENGYGVSYFHEWRRTDHIEILDQVPVFYIHNALYHYIENDIDELPRVMLDTAYKRAYIRKGQERVVLDYAFIITNGNDILAIDTIGYQIPLRKSRLIPRQEHLVFNLIKDKRRSEFKLPLKNHEKKHGILSLEPKYMFGLTRKERQLKQVLMLALDQLRTANNIEEMRYWLTEWNPKKYPLLNTMDKNEVWQALYHGVKKGWSKSNEELAVKLIKDQPFLEKMWELEQEHEHNKFKLK
jgi:hypothetical protein